MLLGGEQREAEGGGRGGAGGEGVHNLINDQGTRNKEQVSCEPQARAYKARLAAPDTQYTRWST